MIKKTPAAPAPEGFWGELRGYHDQLWQDTKDAHRRRMFATYTTGEWVRQDPEDKKLAVATVWEARRFLGGVVIGSLETTHMRIADVRAIIRSGEETARSEAPVEKGYFMYLIDDDPKAVPVLGVDRRLSTPMDAPETRRSSAWAIELLRTMNKMQPPQQEHYGQILAELAAGASGQYQVPPQAV